jgi:hypothetical protein
MEYDLWISARGELRSDPDAAPLDAQMDLRLVAGQHPMALTTNVDDRDRLVRLFNNRSVLIEPSAKASIRNALEESKSIPPPIMKPTDYELVAYLDEIGYVIAKDDVMDDDIWLTKGKKYYVRRVTAKYLEPFERKRVHFNEKSGESYTLMHEMQLAGRDSGFMLKDDRGYNKIFRAHFRAKSGEIDEARIWDFFEKPEVKTIKDKYPEEYEANLNALELQEMISGNFEYLGAQKEYIASVALTDSALVAAETGCGKSAMAIGLMTLKSSVRTLLIAPKGTVKDGEGNEEEYDPAQWIAEFQKFNPSLPVYTLFSTEEYEALIDGNDGVLPAGVYVSYDAAMFRTGAMEAIPRSWFTKGGVENKLREEIGIKRKWTTGDVEYHTGVGRVQKGYSCIVRPSLATRIQADHARNCVRNGERVTEVWDTVVIDEAHLICNLDSAITNSIIKLQPKQKYCLTATPIPNMIWNIFPIMGWLCVPNWYQGDKLNPRWPYPRERAGRFRRTFVSYEHDLTQAEMNRRSGSGASSQKPSPIISEPTRLLKLLKPTLAFISKEQCNPDLQPCQVIDVRVPMGDQQSRLYDYWLRLGNYTHIRTPFRKYGVQLQYLRGVTASPCDGKHAKPWCDTPFNPKMMAIMEKARECLGRDEQVVIVYARQAMGTELASRFSQCGIQTSRIDGTVQDHATEANAFKKGKTQVLLMGINCAQAHSFTQCRNLIIASLEWSYGKFNQAKGRVWRLNSPHPVKIYVILHHNSIEEAMFDKLANKEDTATICLYGKRVPNNTVTMSPSEILAEHLFDWDNMRDPNVTIPESECEEQWVDLCNMISKTQATETLAAA